jgi:hypothetical protein
MTDVPWQTEVAEEAIETPAANELELLSVTGLETTGFGPLIQLALEVSRQVTTSPPAAE